MEPDAGLVQEIQRAGLTDPIVRTARVPVRAGLPEAVAVATRLGNLLDFPEPHTRAVPRPTTTAKNSNVRPGAVSMVNIHPRNNMKRRKRCTSAPHK
jgi:hypothetical protein